MTVKLPDTNLRKIISQSWMNQHPVIVGNRDQTAVEGTVKGWRKGYPVGNGVAVV
ncbi:MAG: hypothetical protein Q8T04_07925 [Bacteroidota bacterium]|nr:hypothetical protein [Bacteroidota bacterium]